MILNIQDDESFDSFLSRNNFLLGRYPGEESTFLSAKAAVGEMWNFKVLEVFSEHLGGREDGVVDLLLQKHTLRPATETFLDSRVKFVGALNEEAGDISAYIRNCGIGICIACAESDVSSKGFAYWRRNHQAEVDVCAEHNVYLKRNCSCCGKQFSLNGLYSDFLWETCSCGARAFDGECRVNEDWYSLRISEFYSEVLKSTDCFDAHVAISNIVNRLESSALDSRKVGLFSSLNRVALRRERGRWWVNIEYYKNIYTYGELVTTDGVLRLAALAYQDFYEFIAECAEASLISRKSPRDKLVLDCLIPRSAR